MTAPEILEALFGTETTPEMHLKAVHAKALIATQIESIKVLQLRSVDSVLGMLEGMLEGANYTVSLPVVDD